MIRRELWIGRLTKARHITDHRDRTVPVVTALQSPRRDRRVVHRSIEREVELHIPLQPIDDRAGAADSQVRRKRVGHRVRKDVPVTRRCFGIRTVRPELGDRSIEVACSDHVRRVGITGDGIDRVTGTSIRSDRVVAEHGRRNVDHVVACGVEQAAIADDFEGLRLEERIGRRVAEPRRRPWIERHAQRAAGRDGEGGHVSPVRANGLLNAARQDDAVLAHEVLDLERLPAVRVDDRDLRERDDERRVDRLVVDRGVPVRFVRTVRAAIVEHRFGDAISHGRGRVAVRRRGRGRIRQCVHEVGELGERFIGADRLDEACRQHAVGGVTDRLVASRGDVARIDVRLFLEDVARGGRVVSRPSVPHRNGDVKQIACVHRRIGEGTPDRVEQGFIPAPRDRLRRLVRARRTGGRPGGRFPWMGRAEHRAAHDDQGGERGGDAKAGARSDARSIHLSGNLGQLPAGDHR